VEPNLQKPILCLANTGIAGERDQTAAAGRCPRPRKAERSGISEAVGGHVLIYTHKVQALADVERRYPAERYVSAS